MAIKKKTATQKKVAKNTASLEARVKRIEDTLAQHQITLAETATPNPNSDEAGSIADA